MPKQRLMINNPYPSLSGLAVSIKHWPLRSSPCFWKYESCSNKDRHLTKNCWIMNLFACQMYFTPACLVWSGSQSSMGPFGALHASANTQAALRRTNISPRNVGCRVCLPVKCPLPQLVWSGLALFKHGLLGSSSGFLKKRKENPACVRHWISSSMRIVALIFCLFLLAPKQNQISNQKLLIADLGLPVKWSLPQHVWSGRALNWAWDLLGVSMLL